MAIFQALPVWLQLILFPLITLGLWTLLFNSQNELFTKIFVEGGYLIVVIPLIILTFMSIPAMALVFWANSSGAGAEVTYALVAVLLGITLIVEYFYIKRMVGQIEEKEQMSIWQYIRREFSSEHQENKATQKVKTAEEAREFFDEIGEMNRKKRELDREEKEKLRRALLGEVNPQPEAENQSEN